MSNNLKKLFHPFYQKHFKKEFLKDDDVIIAIDTNYLLSILRLPTDIAKKYLQAIEENKNNIYIPYFVALEFSFNKFYTKKEKSNKMNTYKNDFSKLKSNLNQEIDKYNKLIVNNDTDKLTNIRKKFNDSFDDLKKFQDEIISNNRNQKDEDNVYNQLISLIENKIGSKPTQSFINKVQDDGKKRYDEELPPGFNDAKSKNNIRRFDGLKYEQKYGDLLIWKDIIDHVGKEKKGKLVFVTDDGQSSKKNDYLFKYDNEIVGPNIYLIDELYSETKASLYIIKNEDFVNETVSLNHNEQEEINNYNISFALDDNFNDEDFVSKNKEMMKNIHYFNDEDFVSKNKEMMENIHHFNDEDFVSKNKEMMENIHHFNDEDFVNKYKEINNDFYFYKLNNKIKLLEKKLDYLDSQVANTTSFEDIVSLIKKRRKLKEKMDILLHERNGYAHFGK